MTEEELQAICDRAQSTQDLLIEANEIAKKNPVVESADIMQDLQPAAARQIGHIMAFGVDERVRLKAAQYILDYGKDVGKGKDNDLENFMKSFMTPTNMPTSYDNTEYDVPED